MPLKILILGIAGMLTAAAAAPASLPDESAGLDGITRTLIAAFDQVDIVALGEDHGQKFDSDVRIALIRHPDFARKVRFILVEFANTTQQAALDRYVRGEDAPPALDDPFGLELLAAVRDVNRKLPAEARIRVLAGDPPAGSEVTTRDPTAVSVLKKEVLAKHGKALLVYGAAHFYRTEVDQVLAGVGGGITKLLEAEYPGRTLAVIPVSAPASGFQKFESTLKTPARPVLVSFQRPPFRDLTADEFMDGKMLNCRGRNGCVSVFQGTRITLGQLADAGIYWRAAAGATPARKR
jgi:hypothetical protein